jgi:hypothetical protein
MSRFTGINIREVRSSGFTYIPSSGGNSSYSLGSSGGSSISYNGVSNSSSVGAIVTSGGSITGLYC